jgi:polysaccharide biosynthesis/export protein ExoF
VPGTTSRLKPRRGSSREAVSKPDASVRVATATTSVEPSAAPAAPTIPERPKTFSTAPDAPAGGLFGVGDRLKVAFYERLEVDQAHVLKSSSGEGRLVGLVQLVRNSPYGQP